MKNEEFFSTRIVILCVMISIFAYYLKDCMIISLICTFHRHRQSGIFFGIITVPESDRRQYIMNMWGNKLLESTPHRLRFLSDPVLDYPELTIPFDTKWNVFNFSRDRDRVMKRLTAAQYFLEKTNLNWYWSLTDDVLIDIDLLDDMIDEINVKFDTFNDLVFQGHVLLNPHPYLQGGVGYIFSRKSAKKFLELGLAYLEYTVWNDDFYNHLFFDEFRMNNTDIANPRLIGNMVSRKYYNLILKEKITDFPRCPDEIPGFFGYNGTYPVEMITALHYNDLRFNCKFWRTLKRKKEKLHGLRYYFEPYIDAQLCIL